MLRGVAIACCFQLLVSVSKALREEIVAEKLKNS